MAGGSVELRMHINGALQYWSAHILVQRILVEKVSYIPMQGQGKAYLGSIPWKLLVMQCLGLLQALPCSTLRPCALRLLVLKSPWLLLRLLLRIAHSSTGQDLCASELLRLLLLLRLQLRCPASCRPHARLILKAASSQASVPQIRLSKIPRSNTVVGSELLRLFLSWVVRVSTLIRGWRWLCMWRCFRALVPASHHVDRVSRGVPADSQQQQDAAEHEAVARAPLDHCHAPVTSNEKILHGGHSVYTSCILPPALVPVLGRQAQGPSPWLRHIYNPIVTGRQVASSIHKELYA